MIFELEKVMRAMGEEIEKLRTAIRKHRDQRGDDRCWLDDEELYKTLPEGYNVPQRDTKVELGLCKKFIECRHNPKTEYVSPQRRIEELEKMTIFDVQITFGDLDVSSAVYEWWEWNEYTFN